MCKLTFWTYSKKEVADLATPLSELLQATDLTHDYENTWEWIEGKSQKLNSKINISREHDWEKGKYEKPLIFSFDYKGFHKKRIINHIGKKLVNELVNEFNLDYALKLRYEGRKCDKD